MKKERIPRKIKKREKTMCRLAIKALFNSSWEVIDILPDNYIVIELVWNEKENI